MEPTRGLRKPPALQAGDTVAVVSPSWGGPAALPARFARATAALRRLGFRVRVMPNATGETDGLRDWVSGRRDERVADLHAAFADPEVRGIISSIGGDHSAQLLEDLDFDLIAGNPTVLCGYSDTGALVEAIHARTGLVTFYGPAALPELGEIGGPDPEVVDGFLRVTACPEPPGPLPSIPWQATEDRAVTDGQGRARKRHAGEPRTVLRPGIGTGPLHAGCLPTMRALLGTPWQPDYAGRVLVLEPSGRDPRAADVDLTHLRNAGVLSGLAGLAVGRSAGWDREDLERFHACVLDAARGYGYPVLGGVECTHSSPLLTLPLGVRATIADCELVIEEAAVTAP